MGQGKVVSISKRQTGIAMLLVLMITAVLSVVITLYQYKNRALIATATQAQNHLLARAKLDSVKEELIYMLSTSGVWLDTPSPNMNQRYELPQQFNFWGQPFTWKEATISVLDTNGLVSVVPLDVDALLKLLINAGYEHPTHILAALQDWYDRDDAITINGAERESYSLFGLPRNALPQTVAELQLVKGMDEHWSKIRPYLTMFGTGSINTEYSPNGLLPALIGDYQTGIFLETRARYTTPSDIPIISTMPTENPFLGNRFKISIQVKVENAAYQQTFYLARGRGTKRLTYVAGKVPGQQWTELN